jgi:hypothetical protein
VINLYLVEFLPLPLSVDLAHGNNPKVRLARMAISFSLSLNECRIQQFLGKKSSRLAIQRALQFVPLATRFVKVWSAVCRTITSVGSAVSQMIAKLEALECSPHLCY